MKGLNKMNSMTSAALTQNSLSSRREQRPWLNNLVETWWLANDLYDDVWYVYENRDDKKGTTRPIYWRERLYDGITGKMTLLTDPMNAKLLETAQLFSYNVRESDLVSSLSTQTHIRKSSLIKNNIVWMLLNGINRFSDLSHYDFQSLL